MKNRVSVFFLFVGLAVAPLFGLENSPAGVAGPGKVEKAFAIQQTGNLVLTFPGEWKTSARHMAGVATPGEVILLYPQGEYQWILSVEAINVGTNATKDLDTRKVLAEAGQAELTNSVEKTLKIEDLKGEAVSGCYFNLTDKQLTITTPKPGEFKHLTQGYAKLDGVVLSFRIVSNRISLDEEKAAFEMIKSARFIRKQ